MPLLRSFLTRCGHGGCTRAELPAGAITAREVDRLGMLLRPTDPAKASLNVSQLLGDISTADTAPLQVLPRPALAFMTC